MKFNFSSVNNLTLFDSAVSACFDDEGENKAIAKQDMLDHDPIAGSLICSDAYILDAPYTFSEKPIPFENVRISLEFQASKIGTLGAIRLKHGGCIELRGTNKVNIHLVTEKGEFTIDAIGEWNFCNKERSILTLAKNGSQLVIEHDGKKLEVEIPSNVSNGLEMTGILGEAHGTEAHVYSVEVEPWHTIHKNNILTNFNAEAEKALKEYSVQKIENVFELSHPEAFGLTKQHTNEKPTTMNEEIGAFFARITGLSESTLKTMDRKALLRLMYNGLLNEKSYAELSHEQLKKEAYFMVGSFLDGSQPFIVPSFSLGGKSYKTYEFGELNDSNSDASKLLYLVKTYPKEWLDRVILN